MAIYLLEIDLKLLGYFLTWGLLPRTVPGFWQLAR
jgi:hypothetical protein